MSLEETSIADWIRAGDVLSDEERALLARLEAVNFVKRLEELDARAGLGVTYQTVGFRASSGAVPGGVVVYVRCRKAPNSASSYPGWLYHSGWWEFSPGPAESPIPVGFMAAQDAILQAIVGSCMDTKGGPHDGYLTQGLSARQWTTLNPPQYVTWGINVKHMFDPSGPTSPNNAVSFCMPTDSEQNQCQKCVASDCPACFDQATAPQKVVVAQGVDQIKCATAPANDPIDSSIYRIPDNIVVRHLAISSVLNSQALLDIKNDHQAAYNMFSALAGTSNPLNNAGVHELWELAKSRNESLYVFRKSRTTGWTFGRLNGYSALHLSVEPIGRTTEGGDCGAILFAVNPVTKQAAAIGYHTQILLPFGGSVWYQISVPYSSVVASQFSGIDWNKFTWHAHDSYTF